MSTNDTPQLVRNSYGLDALVALIVDGTYLAPPRVERRDRLARHFGIDAEALVEGRTALQRVLRGRDLELERERLTRLPALLTMEAYMVKELLSRLEHEGPEASLEGLLSITSDCVAAASARRIPIGSVPMEGLSPLARHLVEVEYREAVREQRQRSLDLWRAIFRTCLLLLYPDVVDVPPLELDEEPYDELDWL